MNDTERKCGLILYREYSGFKPVKPHRPPQFPMCALSTEGRE